MSVRAVGSVRGFVSLFFIAFALAFAMCFCDGVDSLVWHRYLESPAGDFRVMEQEEVYNSLMAQPDTNADAVEIDAAIEANKASAPVELVVRARSSN